jgi:hypothetical protein
MGDGVKKVKAAAEKRGSKFDEVVNLAEGLVTYSEGFYSDRREAWENNYAHWKNDRGQGDKFLKHNKHLPIPLAWMICDGVLASMTDGKPKPVFLPDEKGDVAQAELIGRIMMGPIWEALRMEERNEMLLESALAMAGACASRVGVDMDGNPFLSVFDPYHLFPEPRVTLIEDMEYFATRVPVSVGSLKRAYGSLADKITAEEISDNRQKPVKTSYEMMADYQMPGSARGRTQGDYAGSPELGDIGRAFLTHVWLRDYRMGNVPFELAEVEDEFGEAGAGGKLVAKAHENHIRHVEHHRRMVNEILGRWGLSDVDEMKGQEQALPVQGGNFEQDYRTASALMAHIAQHLEFPQAEQGLVYPQGRELWVCQGVVLDDRVSMLGNPYKGYQFIRDIGGNFFGRSLMDYLLPLQEQFNLLVTKIAIHADVVANGRFFYNDRLNILWDKVKEKTGGKIPVGFGIPVDGSPRDGILWDYGGNMPGYVFQLLGALEQWAYKVGGFTEVMQGSVPAYASGSAMGQAVSAAGVRIRKGVKHLGWYYRDLFRELIKYLKYADPSTMYNLLSSEDKLEEQATLMNINFDAFSDVRIDTRNVLGSWRESQFDKLAMIVQRQPMLGQILIAKMLEYIDVAGVDLQQLDQRQAMESALGQAHDALSVKRAGM